MVERADRPAPESTTEPGSGRTDGRRRLPFRDRRAAVPLRIAPLLVVGLVLVVLAIIAAATL